MESVVNEKLPGLLRSQYEQVRTLWDNLCKPLVREDYVMQTEAGVSPPKWHLAHTTWFFEEFILKDHLKGYEIFNEKFPFLFNSYYNSMGQFMEKESRGMVSRPTLDDVLAYRRHVDSAMNELFTTMDSDSRVDSLLPMVRLGLNHEQQHQELFLMDIKNIFYHNPLNPVYKEQTAVNGSARPAPFAWHQVDEGLTEIGFAGDEFCYDNEEPRHKTFLQNHAFATRPVLNGEYLEFIKAGGYRDSRYWLSDGWNAVHQHGWFAPKYWLRDEGGFKIMTLNGMKPIDENEPVSHVSYYEADAFARWKGLRLPTEFEWEHTAQHHQIRGNFMDDEVYHPTAPQNRDGEPCADLYGNLWEWTMSPYMPYPGFQALAEGVKEYNGKFMCNQFVLRGGCCATPADHIRPTYRNFFYPDDRWQFSGFRLAKDL